MDSEHRSSAQGGVRSQPAAQRAYSMLDVGMQIDKMGSNDSIVDEAIRSTQDDGEVSRLVGSVIDRVFAAFMDPKAETFLQKSMGLIKGYKDVSFNSTMTSLISAGVRNDKAIGLVTRLAIGILDFLKYLIIGVSPGEEFWGLLKYVISQKVISLMPVSSEATIEHIEREIDSNTVDENGNRISFDQSDLDRIKRVRPQKEEKVRAAEAMSDVLCSHLKKLTEDPNFRRDLVGTIGKNELIALTTSYVEGLRKAAPGRGSAYALLLKQIIPHLGGDPIDNQ